MEKRQLAQGCLLGALIGDAAGARLEFLGRRPTEQDLEEALAMMGGGVLGVAPGQITDDGELTLVLATALVGENEYPREKVAIGYRRWAASSPFDIGHATRAALGGPVSSAESASDAVARHAHAHNQESKANGAMMRASALGIWSTRLSVDEAIRAALDDARLTHPNPSCQWANAAYVVAIRHMLCHPGDAAGAFAQAREALDSATGDEAAEVNSWLEDAANGNLPAGHPMAGFVRIAFTHAFSHLVRGTTFEQALHDVLSCGGDTDTNACIVGGLVGARVGLDGIPRPMAQAVLECVTDRGRPRPHWLSSRAAKDIARALVA